MDNTNKMDNTNLLIQTPIEDIASLNIPKSQALIDQEHPIQVEGETYPRRNFVQPELRCYPPFITNKFFSAFIQGWEDQEWLSIGIDYRSKNGYQSTVPTKTWLSDKSWTTIDTYLEINFGTNLALEWFSWHIDEVDSESINMEIRQNDKHGRLIMRVHFTPALVQEGDHVLIGRKEWIVDAMDSDNINLLSTAKPKDGARTKREYYAPNDFFEALASGDIKLVQLESDTDIEA